MDPNLGLPVNKDMNQNKKEMLASHIAEAIMKHLENSPIEITVNECLEFMSAEELQAGLFHVDLAHVPDHIRTSLINTARDIQAGCQLSPRTKMVTGPLRTKMKRLAKLRGEKWANQFL